MSAEVVGASARRATWGRLPRLVLFLVAIALVTASCASRGSSGPNAPTSKVTELRSVSELQTRFEKDRGKIRLILLMSPT